MDLHCLRVVFFACLLLLSITSLVSAKGAEPEGTVICDTSAASPSMEEIDRLADQMLRNRNICHVGRGGGGCVTAGDGRASPCPCVAVTRTMGMTTWWSVLGWALLSCRLSHHHIHH